VHYPRLRIRSKIYGHATGREASAERSMSVVATASTPSVNRLTLGPVRGQKQSSHQVRGLGTNGLRPGTVTGASSILKRERSKCGRGRKRTVAGGIWIHIRLIRVPALADS
jgi:hypothetical protein